MAARARIAYDDGFNTYVAGADGTGKGVVNAGTTPAWSPDGARIASSREWPSVGRAGRSAGIPVDLGNVFAPPAASRGLRIG